MAYRRSWDFLNDEYSVARAARSELSKLMKNTIGHGMNAS
jgi:hypothetical protein